MSTWEPPTEGSSAGVDPTVALPVDVNEIAVDGSTPKWKTASPSTQASSEGSSPELVVPPPETAATASRPEDNAPTADASSPSDEGDLGLIDLLGKLGLSTLDEPEVAVRSLIDKRKQLRTDRTAFKARADEAVKKLDAVAPKDGDKAEVEIKGDGTPHGDLVAAVGVLDTLTSESARIDRSIAGEHAKIKALQDKIRNMQIAIGVGIVALIILFIILVS